MEKRYIAPSLTVVAIHVERGYADSIRASADDVALDLKSLISDGCTGNTPEERTVRTNWGTETNTFWDDGEF